MSTCSQELYDQWTENGGDLEQYREQYHRDVHGGEHGGLTWHPSFVYRFNRTGRDLRDPSTSDVGENYRPPREMDSYSHLLFKHRFSDTWLHVKSGTHIIVGEPVGFHAYVTVRGQTVTVGEYCVSDDPDEVFQWARDWMKAHPEGYDGGGA